MVKAADMLIARRADTRARADFATWKMMAKLNGLSALPPEAQSFLATYRRFLDDMGEPDASETAIGLVYKAYYAEMGGAGNPPEVPSRAPEPAKVITPENNVTAFRRPSAKPKRPAASGGTGTATGQRPRLPVALIFACLCVVYVAIRYFWR